MANILILTIFYFIGHSLGQCNIDRASNIFKRSIFDFSADLTSRIAEETENHFVSSPLSLWSLISPLTLVSGGSTRSELNSVLRLKPNKCFNEKFFALLKDIESSRDGTTLEKSSTWFLDEKLSVKPEFRGKIEATGTCNVNVLPFDNFVYVASTINRQVSTKTHGVIDEVISPSDLEGVYVVLIDVIYFKGQWRVPFLPENTELSPFYDEKGEQIGDVNLMFMMEKFNLTEINSIGAKVVEIPYGNEGRFSMLLFLPKRGFTLSSVIENLKIINLSTIFNSYKYNVAETVSLQIPKFKIFTDLDNLKELLIDMGLKSMFDSSRAEFPGISDYSLYVSTLLQKASIEVSEEGTEASAVTEAEFQSRMLPEEFVANKPFLYMVVDRKVQVPIFIGAYSKPSV